MITHLAHVAGHQNMAKTTTATAIKKRQKQNFMFSPPSFIEAFRFYRKTCSYSKAKIRILCKIWARHGRKMTLGWHLSV